MLTSDPGGKRGHAGQNSLAGGIQQGQQALILVAGDQEQPLLEECLLRCLAGTLKNEIREWLMGNLRGAAEDPFLLGGRAQSQARRAVRAPRCGWGADTER